MADDFEGPLELYREMEKFVDVTRGRSYAKVKRGALERGAASVELIFPKREELVTVFRLRKGPFEHLQALKVFGVADELPLDLIVRACPRLTRLELHRVDAEMAYSPLQTLTALQSLTINGCAHAFSSVADGHLAAWLAQLTQLTELDLKHSYVNTKMLQQCTFLKQLRYLDVSFTFVDIVPLASELGALETLIVGDDANTELSQLFLLPKIPKRQLPSLRRVTVFVPAVLDESFEHVLQRAKMFLSWAEEKELLEVIELFLDMGRSFAPQKEEVVGGKHVVLRHHPILHDLSHETLLKKRVFEVGWHIHAQNERGAVDDAWIYRVCQDLLEAAYYWRHSPGRCKDRSVIHGLCTMLVLLSRWDHGINVKHPVDKTSYSVCRSITQLSVAVHFFMLLNDAVIEALAETPAAAERNEDNDDPEMAENVPSMPRVVCSLLLRLLTWSYDVSDNLIDRSTQASLITFLNAHRTVAQAMALAPESLHAGMVLYAQLCSSQPFKGRLLAPVQDVLLSVLDRDHEAGVGVREAALTCLGNLASYPPNTVALVTSHPEVLTTLQEMLGDIENAESAYGAAYLTGNLSYIAPALVGAPFWSMPEFRAKLARLYQVAFEKNGETSCFWCLWSRCHSRDAYLEVKGQALELEGLVEDDVKLAKDIMAFCNRYKSNDTIQCLWTNLVGVRRLLNTRIFFIKAFSWWLLGNILYQPKHRRKFALAFDHFCPIILGFPESEDGFFGVEHCPGLYLSMVTWFQEAVDYLMCDVDFAKRVLPRIGEFRKLYQRLGLRTTALDQVANIVEEDMLQQQQNMFNFFA